MKNRKVINRFISIVVAVAILSSFGLPVVFAQSSESLLPATKLSVDDCVLVMKYVEGNYKTPAPYGPPVAIPVNSIKYAFANRTNVNIPMLGKSVTTADILGCGIKTGNIKLWMLPYYIRTMLEFVLGLAGLIAVGGIVYGGYLYLFAGLSDDKDKGKKAIMYGVGGFALAMLAFALVNIVVSLLSG